jgi:hypothetical protein
MWYTEDLVRVIDAERRMPRRRAPRVVAVRFRVRRPGVVRAPAH